MNFERLSCYISLSKLLNKCLIRPVFFACIFDGILILFEVIFFVARNVLLKAAFFLFRPTAAPAAVFKTADETICDWEHIFQLGFLKRMLTVNECLHLIISFVLVFKFQRSDGNSLLRSHLTHLPYRWPVSVLIVFDDVVDRFLDYAHLSLVSILVFTSYLNFWFFSSDA